MTEIRCRGLLAFSSLSQTENEKICALGKEIKKNKHGCHHPFRFKLIKQSASGFLEGTWEFWGIRRCTNMIPTTATVCRQCMVRNGKNEEYYSKNHGRIDTMFENKTSKLYGSPIYTDLINKGWNIDSREEIFCKMLQEEAISGLKIMPIELVDKLTETNDMLLTKRIRTTASAQVQSPHPHPHPHPQSKNKIKTLLIDDSVINSKSIQVPTIFPKPLMIQKGVRKISVKKIIYITPQFEIIDGVKYYIHSNGSRIKIPEVFLESIEKYPAKVVEAHQDINDE